MTITRERFKEIIIEEYQTILREDQLSDIKKNIYDSVQKYTPSAVVEELGLAIHNAYDDGKVTKTYVKKAIAALTSVQKRLNKAIS